MANSPSHRSAQSVSLSSNNLQPPTQRQQRRMTSPSPASSSSLRLPEGAQRPHAQSSRPPSPLRNGFGPDTSTGIHPNDVFDDDDDDEDDDEAEDDDQDDRRANRFTQHKRWSERSASPSSSMSQLAATLAQRVGSFVGGIGGSASGGSGPAVPLSPGARSTASTLPSDAELEAEAEREREKSRREAEKILTREARERKALEERVLAMMENAKALPPPPSRSYSLPNPPASPSASTKEREKEGGGWWAAAKSRLTPTKEKDSLTPAQQVILDAKAREKEREKDKKKDKKDKDKEKDGVAALANLNIPVAPPQRKPPPSPSSPTPSRPQAPNLSPSPMRSTEGSSPSREAPPLYAQFTPQGTLDVPGTLLTIVKRFEKLEKWTVGHVRALEERMSDVERWLVDKEKEKDGPKSGGGETLEREVKEVKDGFAELQGRITELCREVAKMATAPTNLASGPERQPASVSVAPQTSSSFAVHEHSDVPTSSSSPAPLPTPAPRPPLPQPPTSSTSASASPSSSAISAPMTPHTSRYFAATARESTSPPLSTSRMSSGTRLPYPTGDYASPPDAPFSPPTSPPSSLSSATRTRPMSIAGLPSAGAGAGAAGFGIGLGLGLGLGVTSKSSSQSLASTSRVVSPSFPAAQQQQTVATAAAVAALPPPKPSGKRTSSVSPTPRKRYTVALGEPIVGAPSPPSDLADEPDEFQDETIRAKPRDGSGSASSASVSSRISAAAAVAQIGEEVSGNRRDGDVANGNGSGNGNGNGQEMTIKPSSPSPSPLSISKRRLRAQSAYGLSSLLPPTTPTTPTTMMTTMTTTPLRPRIRSRSIDPERDRRLGAGAGEEGGGAVGAAVPSNGGNGDGGPAVFAGTGRFVDPLVLRRQDRESSKIIMPKPIGKVPIEQLVAFFDGERRSDRN